MVQRQCTPQPKVCTTVPVTGRYSTVVKADTNFILNTVLVLHGIKKKDYSVAKF